MLNYWKPIIDTVLEHDNSPQMRARLAREIGLRMDTASASEVLDYLYF